MRTSVFFGDWLEMFRACGRRRSCRVFLSAERIVGYFCHQSFFPQQAVSWYVSIQILQKGIELSANLVWSQNHIAWTHMPQLYLRNFICVNAEYIWTHACIHAEKEAARHSTRGRTCLSSLGSFGLHRIYRKDVCPHWSDNRFYLSKHWQIHFPHG